jgi:hypothetical protein
VIWTAARRGVEGRRVADRDERRPLEEQRHWTPPHASNAVVSRLQTPAYVRRSTSQRLGALLAGAHWHDDRLVVTSVVQTNPGQQPPAAVHTAPAPPHDGPLV